MERWFVVENENKKGPFELAVLREMLIAGELALDTILLREGGVVQRIGNSSHFILSKSAEFPLDLAPI